MSFASFVENHWKEEVAVGGAFLLGAAAVKYLPEIFGSAKAAALVESEGAAAAALGRVADAAPNAIHPDFAAKFAAHLKEVTQGAASKGYSGVEVYERDWFRTPGTLEKMIREGLGFKKELPTDVRWAQELTRDSGLNTELVGFSRGMRVSRPVTAVVARWPGGSGKILTTDNPFSLNVAGLR